MPAVRETVDTVRRIDVDQYKYGFVTDIESEKAPKGLSEDTVRFISVSDVDWIEADRNYVFLHVGDVKHRLRASLRHVTARLDPRTFVRIHRSAVVNSHCIREVQPWFGGDYVAILRNGTKLKVSRLRASKLLKPMT